MSTDQRSDGPMIQLHRLEGFYWVARTGGYARAARAFPYPITQPAVHNQVKKLEEELGVSLFERVAKDRMAPTAPGRRLYDFVRPFFESLPAVLRSVRGGEYGGELRVASSSLLLRHLVPAWIRRLHGAHPGVEVHLEENGGDALDLLRRGQVDLAIDHFYEVPDDVATMPVAELTAFVVAPEDAADEGDVTRLADVPFVAYSPGMRARELQFAGLSVHELAPRSMLSGSSAETILGFVAAGLGWSILPWLEDGGPELEGVRAFRLHAADGEPAPAFEVVAAWRKDTPENPLLDAMLEVAPRR